MSQSASIVTTLAYEDRFLFPMQAIIKDYLYTDPWFHNFAIITEDMDNVPNMVDQALLGMLAAPNGKRGVSIMLHTLRGRGNLPNIPASYSMSAEAVFIIVEIPAINRGAVTSGTGIPALVVAETLIAVMKNFRSSEIATSFREPDKPQGPPHIDKELGLVAHEVTMLFHGGVEDTTPVVAQPVITLVGEPLMDEEGIQMTDEDGNLIYADPDENTTNTIIICATEGAVVYYTTDGLTRPTSSATEYGGLFDSRAFSYIWARAYRPGYRASTIAKADIVSLMSEVDDGLLEESGGALFP